MSLIKKAEQKNQSQKKKVEVKKAVLVALPKSILSGKRRYNHIETQSLLESKSESAEGASSSVARMLVNPQSTYEFRLISTGSLQASGGGTLYANLDWDPSASSEWSSIDALFDEVRLIRCRLRLFATNAPSGTALPGPLALGSRPALANVAPTTFNQVCQLPDMKFFPVHAYALSNEIIFNSPGRPNKVWASVSSPAPSVDQGCYGQFEMAVAGSLVASAFYYVYCIEYFVEMRSRS